MQWMRRWLLRPGTRRRKQKGSGQRTTTSARALPLSPSTFPSGREARAFAALPFQPETDLEAAICLDPDWQKGAVWGRPRPGHPEGQVRAHIAEVLANVDRHAPSPEERQKLRVITLIHDSFKYQVDPLRPNTGANHHATLARRFAERYLDDPALLEVIELHDEAYNSWCLGSRKRRWQAAEERADRLIDRLGENLPLYLRFFRCDNATGSKQPEPVEWFEERLRARGIAAPPAPADN